MNRLEPTGSNRGSDPKIDKNGANSILIDSKSNGELKYDKNEKFNSFTAVIKANQMVKNHKFAILRFFEKNRGALKMATKLNMATSLTKYLAIFRPTKMF